MKTATPIAKGLPASPGAAAGKVYFTAEGAANAGRKGIKVILVREETTPEDIEGMDLSKGILTARGGMTSHAAVVARGMGRAAVVGCGELHINEEKKTLTVGGKVFHEGDDLSLDGSTGNVYGEAIPTVEAAVTGDFARLMKWADAARTLKVRTNADTPRDTKQAVNFGAEGIGLCRTEHMFFEADRIAAVREMILSDTVEQREAALAKILPMQQSDFEAMYIALEGRPMTVRYLDPPLHEFLPSKSMTEEIADIAKELDTTCENIMEKIDALHEFNPMMGHRGCRLAVTFPEIADMQTRAVHAGRDQGARRKTGFDVVPEIMIPLVGDAQGTGVRQGYRSRNRREPCSRKQGTTLDLPHRHHDRNPARRVTADEIAKEAEFFSFGTNDLTQMTFGFSRDDAGKFLDSYYQNKIFESDPFATLDQDGVGKLVQMAVKLGRETRADLKLGICGEHGGDPSSIEFCHNVGLNYVSCSPFRVPIARLAAAHAAIKAKK